ncbi:hypothetical protein [Poseidonocella sp. HB161398]|uniref:hypothetical protein n=1 Tax=Poseidonocella sp. HB161398 TaxID=2320855 RepID=UPI0011083A11|nr:hypothetical protein [Poseidonocella sp. HB161398]
MSMSGRKYRLGRSAAWLLSLLGWVVMAGGLVMLGLGVFQMIRLGTRDLLTLAPYIGGGAAVLLNGLFMVAGAQLMLAVFDIALSGRALVLNVPGKGAAAPPETLAPEAPVQRRGGRAEPLLRRPAQGDEDED